MIFGQTLRVCPEGKPASTYPQPAPIQLASGRTAILEDITAVALSHARLDHIGSPSLPKA
jgi:glyoxylase-like metal-dependent hydrolase (beta-lactamase superfamily II)